MRVIEQTRDRQVAMYLKLTKRELAEMLVNANEALIMALALTGYNDLSAMGDDVGV